jgi:hypothetical protein
MSQGGWAACERCHQLIKAGDRRGLVVRSLITLISSSPDMEPDQAELRETIAELHQKFFENRIGDAVPYVDEEVLVNGELT